MEYSERIKAARKHAGLTQAELATAVGIAQASVSDMERGKSVSSSFNASIAKACGVSALWLEREEGHMVPPTQGSSEPYVISKGPQLQVRESNVIAVPPVTSAARRISIVGTAQMGPEGHWIALDNSGGWVEAWTRDDDAYALELRGDSMSPAIRNGWVAVCEPNHRLVPGEYVMVTTTDGESMVKELLFHTENGVSLMSLNSAYERRSLAWTEIDTIHYVAAIMGPSKVMGRI